MSKVRPFRRERVAAAPFPFPHHSPTPARRMHRSLPALALLLAIACSGSSGSGSAGATPTPPTAPSTPTTPTGPVATTAVTLQGNAFNPPAIVVSPGATVTFTNQDNINHNVTFDGSSVSSVGNFQSGSRAVVMPATAGSYGYRCTLHPGMSGSVQVK